MSLLGSYLRTLPLHTKEIPIMNVQCYLMFDGCCEAAIEFYRRTVGAELQSLMRHRDSPEPPPPGVMGAGYEDKVLHAEFRIGETRMLASDGYCHGKAAFQGITLTLNVRTPEEADRHFHALVEGGQVTMPLSKTFWSPRFGMLTDRFGVSWMIHCI